MARVTRRRSRTLASVCLWSLSGFLACGGGGDEEAGTETETEGMADLGNDDDFGDGFDDDDDNDDDFDDDFDDDGFDDNDDDDDDNDDDDDDDDDDDADSSGSDSGSESGTDSGTDTGTDDGETDGGPDSGDCCMPHDDPGCEVDDVQTCVCDEDPFCCDETWDPICTVLVVTQNCGTCSNIGGDGDCCMENESPGCDDDAVEACVCEMDVACCLQAWDMLCVMQVESGDCGQC